MKQAFIAGTGASAGDATPSEIAFDNHRSPVFLSAHLAVVPTDSTMTVGGARTEMRYVDVMAKTGGEWRFTSMIQAGRGDLIRRS